MIRALVVVLDPTKPQTGRLRSHCGGQRVAYNFALKAAYANMALRKSQVASGVKPDKMEPWIATSGISLRKAWTKERDNVAPWHRENSVRVYEAGCFNAANAFKRYFDGLGGAPKPKTRNSKLSYRLSDGKQLKLGSTARKVYLPNIGYVRTHESTRGLKAILNQGGRIRSATVSFQRGRWQVSFSLEVPDAPVPVRTKNRVVGIDLGIKNLATLSTGEVIPNPKHLQKAQLQLRKLQQQLSRAKAPVDLSTTRQYHKQPGSKHYQALLAGLRKTHTRVANMRRDNLHKLTTDLVNRFDTIVIEDLDVRSLLMRKQFSEAISDASWGELRRQLTYKAERAGVKLLVADKFYPSTKTCSHCGSVKARMRLSERTYTCSCGTRLDRDLNAALNLAALAAKPETTVVTSVST